jgi:hypothetical protein
MKDNYSTVRDSQHADYTRKYNISFLPPSDNNNNKMNALSLSTLHKKNHFPVYNQSQQFALV